MSHQRRLSRIMVGWLLLAVWLQVACSGPAPRAGSAGGGAQGSDAEWRSAMTAGRKAYDRGQLAQAARLYRHALQRGRAMDSPPAIADAAYNLAASQLGLGDYAAARLQLQEAKTELLRSGGDLSDLLLVEARLARLLGEPGQALALLESLRAGAFPEGLQQQSELLRGQLACDLGDRDGALNALQQLREGVGENTSPAVRGGGWELAGCLALLRGEALQAAGAFDREAECLREAGQYRQMISALSRAAAAYDRAGGQGEAAERWFRAARSLFTQGQRDEALMLATRAKEAAQRAPEPRLAQRVQSLLEEIAAALRP